MTIVRLEFPAKRYHATPYGRHVNEGVAEWPPSPYRLLRALYDVWQRKCPELSEAEVESVLMALGGALPNFHLPKATATHTRSYLSANGMDSADKNLVFDGFLAFDDGAECYASWPGVQLTKSQGDTLQRLLRNLNYLGRSESWIRAEVSDDTPRGIACTPIDIAEGGGEPVPVACVVPASSYSGKRRWMEALTTSTAEVMKQRASGPPLLRSVRYLRPAECIVTNPPTALASRPLTVQSVLLTLDCNVLPLVTSTLEVAEQVRVRLMGAHKRVVGDERQVSRLFSGKGTDGEKRTDHGHVYILPLGNSKGRIDRVLLTSKDRWTRAELDAAYLVRKLWQAEGRPDVQCAVAWMGTRIHIGPVFTGTRVVESATPFVPPRYWRKGRDFQLFLEEEVRRECRNHGMAEPDSVELLGRLPGHFDCVEFRRNRKNDPVKAGYALRLVFAGEVVAPFALGYGSHFGLGSFLPCLGKSDN